MLRKLRSYLHWGLIGACALLTLVLGAIGWGAELACVYPGGLAAQPGFACRPGGLEWPHQWLTVLYYTLLLFPGQTVGLAVSPDNLALQIARILGPIAAYVAIFRIVAEFMTSRIEAWVIARARNHAIICGLGDRGRAFALDWRRGGGEERTVIAIDRYANEAMRSFCDAHRIHLIEGDCRDPAILRRAAVARARNVVVVTGDDNANLATAMHSQSLAREAGAREAPFKAHVSINHPPLWRELAGSDLIDRRDPNFECAPFSLPTLAARSLLWEEPIYSYADMMNQRRVHAVLVGLGPYGESLLIQIARVCVYKDFDRPAITVLSRDPTLAMRTIDQHLPEVDQAADIDHLPFNPDSDPLDAPLLQRITSRAPATAYFICLERDDEALRTALYVQKQLQRHGRATAPIYVRLNHSDGTGGVLKSARTARRLGDVISAFGTIDELCRFDLIEGDLDRYAIQIHEDYLLTRKLTLGAGYDPDRSESAQEWSALRETYREANRRAADHIKAKIASAGAWQPAGVSLRAARGFSLLDRPEALDALAELEHKSWCAGSYLDGWRHAPERDNRRKLHDNLVPYAELDEAAQQYDKDQITNLDRRIAQSAIDDSAAPDVIRDDLWIGLIGRNHVSAADDRWIAEALRTEVLPKLLDRHGDSHVTLVTPLAPGLDMSMTRAALALMSDRRRPHRLLIIEAVPESAMVRDFLEDPDRLRAGPWGTVLEEELNGDLGELFRRILRERREIVSGPAAEYVIDLTLPDAEYHADAMARRDGYGSASAYIAEKCPVVIAAVAPDAPIKLGGTAETLQRRREAAMTGRTGWPLQPDRHTIVLELESHVIRTE